MSIKSLHTIEAIADLGTVTVPEYTIPHAAEVVYSQGFESNATGWAGTGIDNSRTTDFERTGSWSMWHITDSTGEYTCSRAFGGLTVGRSYTISAWFRSTGNPGHLINIGVAGIGASTAIPSTLSWELRSFTFTATATSHTIELTSDTDTNSGGIGVWDDIALTANAWVEVVPEHEVPAEPFTLTGKEAALKLDDSWTPYAQAELVCSMADLSVVQALDPREGVRVAGTLGQVFGADGVNWNGSYRAPESHTFDLLLVERELNHTDKEMTLRLESDEALLRNYALVSETPERTYGLSVKAAVEYALAKIGAELEPGAADADLGGEGGEFLLAATNLITNSGFEVNTAGYSGSGTISRVTTEHYQGVACARVIALSPGQGSIYWNPPAGEGGGWSTGDWFTASTWVKAPLGATLSLTNATTGVGGGSSGIDFVGTGDWQMVQAPPAQYIEVGGSGPYAVIRTRGEWIGTFYVDLVTIAASEVVVEPFDGSTTDTDEQEYAWTGTVNASTSTRSDLSTDATIWEPGVTAWEYVEPLVQATGLRLYCTEHREWVLEESGTTTDGLITVSEGHNVTEASDVISLEDDAEHFTGVVVTYRWDDAEGVSQTRYDVAGEPDKVFTIEYNRPYPGPGAAASILNRAAGRGRTFALDTMSNYTADPGKPLAATLPDTPVQVGYIRAVEWRLPEARMTITSRGLTDTPDTAWIFDPPGESWADIPVGTNWLEDI